MTLDSAAWIIHIKGLVQGVGFRPFVYRMALQNHIKGWVENSNEGVTIHVEGILPQQELFLKNLKQQAPQAAIISEISVSETAPKNYLSFKIRQSHNFSDAITEVSPDIAVCPECLLDMKKQPHRIGYPFINCTNCGPRFTIIRDLPYDRDHTTMEPFEMCPVCRNEYNTILDRRFHAQPIACKSCGPKYSFLIHEDNELMIKQIPENRAAQELAEYIDSGRIVALKGLGGYHLVCDANNEDAVKSLRLRKNREGKPLAVMAGSIANVKKHFTITNIEENSLSSWRRPIVLLTEGKPFSASVNNGMKTTGVLLPYMPLHYQLFEHLKTDAIVLTSGNISDEPVTISDAEAIMKLGRVADVVVRYNREIHNRADDSVVFIASGTERMLRRSRSFVPSPIALNQQTEGIFAAGAELVNTFAIGKENQVILSQHIGDLKNAETMIFYEESFQRFSKLFRFQPTLVACDSHPDYLSSQFARSLGIETMEIQHHHAHIASCMAEHGLDEKVIGVAFDGTGYGDDGTIWGGEFLLCDLIDYERSYYFDPVPLPGGDKVTHEPWRTAVSYLYKYFGKKIFEDPLDLLKIIEPEHLELLLQAIDMDINCPVSSGAGRLFDAVAALSGVCTHSSFHAEAPMRLEAVMAANCRGKYVFDIEGSKIVFWKLFYLLMKDLHAKVAVSEISAKFHNTMVVLILTVVKKMRLETGINKIVLSGGSFQNRYLLEKSEELLKEAGFSVFTNRKAPSNDGGIALGQMAIASKRRAMKLID
ncbi:MAG: carbamoyltransferase HypF [Bacteroidetes bacterium HGW-Bacteroidetes-1]|jgi:hydrogenase maturation protein HypF|nr:MAG: carbamoyltransferase HypF [Bacteroidetes bacterium HGW-Bacteroidetes-1]